MKYTKKMPLTDRALSDALISTGWEKIKEPSNIRLATLLSVPFMIINAIIFMGIAFYLYPPLKEFLNSLNSNDGFNITLNIKFITLLYIPIIFLFMIIHEFTHACFIPNFLKSDKTYWAINAFYGFVCTTEKIKKSRYIIISIMPFVLLSIILPLILSILGWLNEFILFLCLINAMGSCVDCLTICIVLSQVPNGSYIINNGFETYFKSI
jgi:hypothetical protein